MSDRNTTAVGFQPAPTGASRPDQAMVTENCNCDDSTKSSQVISSSAGSPPAIPGRKSPTLSKPPRMRNR